MKKEKDKTQINGIDIEYLKFNQILIDTHDGDYSCITIDVNG